MKKENSKKQNEVVSKVDKKQLIVGIIILIVAILTLAYAFMTMNDKAGEKQAVVTTPVVEETVAAKEPAVKEEVVAETEEVAKAEVAPTAEEKAAFARRHPERSVPVRTSPGGSRLRKQHQPGPRRLLSARPLP